MLPKAFTGVVAWKTHKKRLFPVTYLITVQHHPCQISQRIGFCSRWLGNETIGTRANTISTEALCQLWCKANQQEKLRSNFFLFRIPNAPVPQPSGPTRLRAFTSTRSKRSGFATSRSISPQRQCQRCSIACQPLPKSTCKTSNSAEMSTEIFLCFCRLRWLLVAGKSKRLKFHLGFPLALRQTKQWQESSDFLR